MNAKTEKNKTLILCVAILLTLLPLLLTVCVSAKEEADGKKGSGTLLPEEYSEVVEGLPSEVEGKLPDGIFSSDAEEFGEAVSDISSAEYILGYIGELASLGLADAFKLLAMLVSIIVISAVFSALRSSFSSETVNKAVGFGTSCAIFGCVISLQISHLERAVEFFESINTFMLSMIPATGVIYAMGGNVTTAISSSGALYLFLAFCENFCAKTIVPVVSVCTAFSICASLAPNVNMRGFSKAVKKCYVFFLGLIMTVLLAALASQTALSSAADTVSSRAAKLVASNIIPIVGGSVGETLRTVASSVGYIKSVCGIGAIIFIILLVLPILVTLLLTRTVFIISVAAADLLGCERESRALSELDSIYGTLIAVICMVSVMFIFALTLFVRCTVAAG